MLSEKQVQEFKKQLEEMKQETEAELDRYREEKSNEDSSSDFEGELSSVSDHPGDLGTFAHERSKEQTLYEQTREKLIDINDALQRIEEGTYGKSVVSGKEIPLERLEVMPTARINVDEAEEEQL
ncbi:TraR/DksA family transcriptional regulator [Halobacillus massiliensis]|uniref:TraR/DksA family transcriptional regulator n=1 Tax=Halobacillus massiliensis TaxID=1926286 RepID=UPI0009E1C881|nr:hypothetical protein [Halobacillus massiliensis]